MFFKSRIYRTLAPVLVLSQIFGLSTVNFYRNNAKKVNFYDISLFKRVIFLIIFCYNIVAGLIYVHGTWNKILSLSPSIYKEIVQTVERYILLGNNLCSLVYLITSVWFFISFQKYHRKITSFYSTAAEIDNILITLGEKICFKKLFWSHLLTIILSLVQLQVLVAYTVCCSNYKELTVSMDFFSLAAFYLKAYFAIDHVILVNSHIMEVTARFRELNLSLER